MVNILFIFVIYIVHDAKVEKIIYVASDINYFLSKNVVDRLRLPLETAADAGQRQSLVAYANLCEKTCDPGTRLQTQQ